MPGAGLPAARPAQMFQMVAAMHRPSPDREATMWLNPKRIAEDEEDGHDTMPGWWAARRRPW